ncbi:MAG: pentapeptide repeat-containing protein [Calditrichae bacterium]|nr:pentapeptide repeat-containing protein [Calditrichota bacterium]MCB9057556.1 pentapeptide repeat-containing protein [Calditrichia bacterium]
MEKRDLYLLLKKERIKEFNEKVANAKELDLQNVNLRGRNLTNANLKYADLRGAYLANSNLKGVNLSHAMLEGASLHRARISGVYFPKNVDAQEILNTINYGTRIRTSDNTEIHENDLLIVVDDDPLLV